jgi:colicin import membrane protein
VRGGLATSVVLHAAILGWALFTIQAQRELPVAAPEPIAVDLVNSSELTRLRQGERSAKQLKADAKEPPKEEPPAKQEAPKPTQATAAAPPEPPPPKEEAKKEEPKKEEPKEEPKKEAALAPPPPAAVPPVPAPDEQKKLDEILKEQERQAEEQKKAEEQKRLEEEKKQAELKKQQEAKKKREAELKKKREEEKKRKAAEAKKRFDAERISALLNKMPDKGAARPSVPLDQQAKGIKGPVLGAPEGRDKQISASEIAILAQIIRSCVQSKWNVMGGGEGAQHTVVKLRLRFNADGTLATAPVVMNPQSTTTFLAISDSAIRAAEACQPYSLPPARYEVWKDIVLNFDPRDMF